MTRRSTTQQPARLAHPLAVVRAQRGWSHQDVVDVIARRVGNVAARREKAWRWEHWGVVPDLDSQRALAAELGVSTADIATNPWPTWLPAGDPIPTAFAWTQDGALVALTETVEQAVLERRGFLKVAGTAMVAIADTLLLAEPAELQTVLRGGHVGADFATRMEEGLPRLRLLEATHGGARARRLIDAELGMVTEVLEHSAYTAQTGTRLYGLAAELARMAGWSSFDAGLHSAAQRYWITGLHAAHAAGNTARAANILKSMSLQCYDFGHSTEALGLAQRSVAIAGNVTPRARAMLRLREARAHAALGDTRACEATLAAAENDLEHARPGDDDPDWLSYFDDSEFTAQVASCWLDLGEHARAEEQFDAAVTTSPAAKVRDRATYIIRRASAQARTGEAEHAVALLTDAVPLVQSAPSQRNVTRLVAARGEVPIRRGDMRTHDLDTELADLVATHG